MDRPDPVFAHALRLARTLTGCDLAYLAEFAEGRQHVRAVAGDAGRFRLGVGASEALEATYCQRVVDGRLDGVVRDAGADARTARLPATTAGIAAYVGVPLRYGDGELYGTLCCVADRPRLDLGEAHRDALDDLGALLSAHLDARRRETAVEVERGALLDAASHDLQTPLMAMRFLGEDLEAGVVVPGEAGPRIRAEAVRVGAMVEDLLLVARSRAGVAFLQPLPQDLGALAREAAASVLDARPGARARVTLALPPAPVVAAVDATKVVRAVANLLDNALKYSPEGSPVRLSVTAEGPTGLVVVDDEGMGIEPGDLPRVAERFFRSERAVAAGIVGTGLGLATVQAVADLHEGTLAATSAPGAGSTFSLRLPLARPATPTATSVVLPAALPVPAP